MTTRQARMAWCGVAVLLALAGLAAHGQWPAVANVLWPAAAWCLLRGLT